MGYKAERWPYKANGAAEDVLSLLKDIERATVAAQKATQEGNKLEAIIAMADVRVMSAKAGTILVEARAGRYAS